MTDDSEKGINISKLVNHIRESGILTVYVILDPEGSVSGVYARKNQMKAQLYKWKDSISDEYSYDQWNVHI